MDIQMLATEALTLEELSYNYSKNNILLRRQLNKKILSNTGVWADLAFLHQDRNLVNNGWKPSKITIVRFKRIDGVWKKQNHLNINSIARIDQIISILSEWRNMVEKI